MIDGQGKFWKLIDTCQRFIGRIAFMINGAQ